MRSEAMERLLATPGPCARHTLLLSMNEQQPSGLWTIAPLDRGLAPCIPDRTCLVRPARGFLSAAR
jgi:hypothetical protein